MFAKFCRLILPAITLVIFTACNRQLTTTDVQLDRIAEARSTPRAHFDYMVDNAIAQDMSMADFHFVGHTTELSGTGVARLDRMAHFIDAYGGTIRYETMLTDDELIEQRLAHVQEYLVLAGCDMERVEVRRMISGGRGMPAVKAIEIDDRGANPPAAQRGATPLSAVTGR